MLIVFKTTYNAGLRPLERHHSTSFVCCSLHPLNTVVKYGTNSPLDLLIVYSPQFAPLSRKNNHHIKREKEMENQISRHVETCYQPVIMKIHLIVCINRRANDTFKSLFAFRQRETETSLRDTQILSPSVNMCDINM